MNDRRLVGSYLLTVKANVTSLLSSANISPQTRSSAGDTCTCTVGGLPGACPDVAGLLRNVCFNVCIVPTSGK